MTPDPRGQSGARIAWPATLAARRGERLRAAHLRYRSDAARGGVLHCFLLDCSASMLEGERLARAKGLIVALFERAARERETVALVCFGGDTAEQRFGPAVPRWWNARWLAPIGGGGGTPLARGVAAAQRVLAQAARRQPAQQRWLWVLSDGRSQESPACPIHTDRIVWVDFDDTPLRLGRGARLAQTWGALCCTPEELVRD